MDKSNQFDFIIFLRGIAAIIVLLSHLLINFWGSKINIGSIWPFLQRPVTPQGLFADQLDHYLSRLCLGAGSVGVAFFFLITGFLIGKSIRKYKSPMRLLISKLLRIYPTYIVGFSITFFIIYLYCHFDNIPFPYTFIDWITQVSLIRIFLWKASIDGITWTLVADVQFYLLIVLLMTKKKTSAKFYCISGILITAVSLLYGLLMPRLLKSGHISLYQSGSHWILAAFCLSYMLIGCILYEYSQKVIDRFQFIAGITILHFCFLVNSVVYSKEAKIYIGSYTFSFIIFLLCYFLSLSGHCKHIFRDPVVGFISKISYPLYIVHGLNGYILETVLFDRGIRNSVNFILTVSAAIILGTILYYTCDKQINFKWKSHEV